MPGPFDRAHVYIQWGGTLPGNEQWSCGLRMAPPVTILLDTELPDFEGMADVLENHIGAAVTTYHSSAGAGINANAKLTFVKANVIKTDGLYRDTATAETVFAPLGGTSNTVPLPNQCTMAISTCTAFSRGPAHRGRWYSPLPAVAVEAANGLVPLAYADQLATAAMDFVTDLNDWPGVDTNKPKVCVMSRKTGAPATRLVTRIEVGRVVDTQRRRRRSLPELYETAGP